MHLNLLAMGLGHLLKGFQKHSMSLLEHVRL